MNPKWTVVTFRHRPDKVYYQWTHAMVDLPQLTPPQLLQIAPWAETRNLWFSPKRHKFLSRSPAELSAIETHLTTAGYIYHVHPTDLTAQDRAIIEKAQVTNRNHIAAILDIPPKIHSATVTNIDATQPRGVTVQRGSRLLHCYTTLIPSIGDRVLVTFIDGDSAQPCVIGRVLGL